ncbi:ABC transporter permease [Clostridium brassicae]|uniref:FtsX-like permease family protein n=1 Tax=Clostridium brassicae TaxID=2999072 RepID=A0ABT4DE21_9CLOT|nr:ABC transporter permease [Clostridium brassicae]MCY6960560.1 FtsX-like permease family protein [Clostridium brassicae]
MNDILFGNNNHKVLNRLVKRSLKSQKNYISILAITLATLLFTSLFTIAISLQSSMQDSNMRTIGTSAHIGIKHITLDEYETVSADSAISEAGHSIIFGYAVGDCFNKTPTEVRWADENYADWTFNYPDEGKLPKADKEIATSRIVLEAMGIPAEIGTPIELTFATDTKTITDTFTLCGIWNGDSVAYRQTILLSKPYAVKNVPAVHGTSDSTVTVSTGYIDGVFMLPSAWNIEEQAGKLAETHGFTDRINVNTAYSTAEISVSNILAVLAGIVVIFFAGYLLIYNVFYISIAQDIRFYGMLKTLGTTARQIRKIVYQKALRLSLIGIPIGLALGWPVGRILLPSIIGMLAEDMQVITTINPFIFIVAIFFSLITVFISCHTPAKIAAKVSPMEALRYVEQSAGKKKQKRSRHISTMMLAKENLSRNKKKVVIVTLSFALSIVLLNSVFTYVNSFDFDKFVSDFSLTDFTVSDASIINSNSPFNTANVSQDFTNQANTLEGLQNIGNIYLQASNQPLNEETLERLHDLSEQSEAVAAEYGNYTVRKEHGVNIYGFDNWPAEYLQILEGNLDNERWQSGSGIYVTPMRMVGDGSLSLYHPGEQVTIACKDGSNRTYEVLAVVTVPRALSTPLSIDMGVEYVLPKQEFLEISGSTEHLPMKTILNVDEEHIITTENWLKNYTTNTDRGLDYYSKVTLRQTFQGMIDMYQLVGGALCAILALIGILNFVNSMATSILSRHKEIAMLQSVGMTGQQVKKMLIFEGISYSLLGLLCSLALSTLASVTIVRMMGNELSYFTWHFTLLPVMLCILPLITLTACIPLLCYKQMTKETVVERLRKIE